jgi:hypothetical protein
VSGATVIAERLLHAAGGEMRVTLFAPEPLGEDMRCGYRITGPETERRGHAIGVDGFQALELAMQRLAIDLAHCSEAACGPLRWLDRDGPCLPWTP